MNKWIKICRRYWFLSVVALLFFGVFPTAFITVNPPLPYNMTAQYEYIKTENIERCLQLFRYNSSTLTEGEYLMRLLIYKYRHTAYYKPLNMSMGMASFLIVGIAIMYEGIDIA